MQVVARKLQVRGLSVAVEVMVRMSNRVEAHVRGRRSIRMTTSIHSTNADVIAAKLRQVRRAPVVRVVWHSRRE